MAFTFVARLNRPNATNISFIGTGGNAGQAYNQTTRVPTNSVWRTSRVVPAGFDNPDAFKWWIARPASFVQSIAAIAIGVAVLATKNIWARTLAATAIGIGTLTTKLKAFVTLASTAIGVAVLATLAKFKMTLSSVCTGIGTLATQFIAGASAVVRQVLCLIGVGT